MPDIKILYIITKLELGGAQKQLLSLVTALDRDKFSPYLFTAASGILVPETRAISGLNIHLSFFLERPLSPVKDLLAFFEMIRFIKKNNINIVHTHSSKAGIVGRLAARVAGVKVIIHTVHGWSFNDFQAPFIRKFYIFLEKLCANFSSKIIVVSQWDKLKGLKENIGKESQYALISYGINHEEFQEKNQLLKRESEVLPSDILIGMVACFKPQKTPQDFIELAKLVTIKVNNAKFLMVGDGVLRPSLQKLISRYGLQDKVVLAGWRRDIPQILSALDIFVLTSLWEGLPIAVLEALVSGKPVVATHTGGISEVIRDGENGFLVAPKEIKQMADKLIRLVNDADLRISMGEKARLSVADSFSISSMVAAHQTLYLKFYS
ncbi:MAG: glycosyltransferase family 4 protein [Candidatus Omnitrophota bacterium]|jgi:glycosyltransferase involved in cell wall biosynthesis